MPQIERDLKIRKDRNRNNKKRALRARLETEKDTKVRARLIAKLAKISPNSPRPEK
jgi:hypothetical protein